MIIQSATLALFLSLALTLSSWSLFDSWELGVRLSAFASSLVFLACGVGQWRIVQETAQGEIVRARYIAPRVERIVEHRLVEREESHALPALIASPTRSIVYNANGIAHDLQLAPEADDSTIRVRHMLDLAIQLNGRESTAFPSVRAMEGAGMIYAEYDAAKRAIESHVERNKNGHRVCGGTLGTLRDKC